MAYQRKWQPQLNNAIEKDESAVFKRVSGVYNRERKYLENEIDHYFAKYGENNVIKYRVLKEGLDDSDKILLIEKFDEFAKKYPQYADLMPIRESIYKLDRLQGLQYSVVMQQLKIGAIEQSEVTGVLQRTALRGANKTASELGFGTAFYKENDVIIKNFVGTDWTKAGDYSSRIWNNREELSNYINNDLAQSFARGDSRDKIVEQMEKRFNAGRKNTERLVYTENTFVMNEAQAKVFEQWFEYYSISTADSRACPICKDLQAEQEREYARFDERESGINFPPMHPWCRCTFNVQVNKNQWMKDYIATGGKPLEAKHIITGALGNLVQNAVINRDYNGEFAKSFGKKDYDDVCNMVEECDNDNYIKIWSEYANDVPYNEVKGGAYYMRNEVYMNKSVAIAGDSIHNPMHTVIHEYSHAIDYAVGVVERNAVSNVKVQYIGGRSTKSVTCKYFREAIQKDYDNLYNKAKEELKVLLADEMKCDIQWLYNNGYIDRRIYRDYALNGKEPKATAVFVRSFLENKLSKEVPKGYNRSGLSDTLQGITKGSMDLGYGHAKSYYSKTPYNCEIEAFANFSAALVSNKDEVEVLKKYMPNAWEAYLKLLEEIADGIS